MKKKSAYQLILIPILMGLILSGFSLLLLLDDLITKGVTTFKTEDILVFVLLAISSSVCFLFWWRKYRTLEIDPDRLDLFDAAGRKPNQCIICKKHPVSKKYHLASEHDLRKVRTMDYFVQEMLLSLVSI